VLFLCFLIATHQILHHPSYTSLKAVNMAALFAIALAFLVIAIAAIPLALLSRELDPRVVEFIEGVSKLVAAVCVLQLSLKIPKFLGVYPSKKGEDGLTVGLSIKSIKFNVAWNIWREVAECGAFLLPFFLTGEGAKAIPLSGIVGIAVGGLMGIIIYYANKQLKSKTWLAVFMAALLLFLSVGLFVGGWYVICFGIFISFIVFIYLFSMVLTVTNSKKSMAKLTRSTTLESSTWNKPQKKPGTCVGLGDSSLQRILPLGKMRLF
jgi:hypothetical protein